MDNDARITTGSKEATADETPGRAPGGEDSIEDPFAFDLFAQRPAAAPGPRDAADLPAARDSARGPRWDAGLPRVTARQARLSAALALPTLFPRAAEACAEVIALYTALPPEEVSVRLEEVREGPLAAAARDAAKSSGVWVSLAVEPDGDRLLLETDSSFCASLVDRAAGGDGGPADSLSPLTETEMAVFEFLCLALVREFNVRAGKPLFRLDAVGAAAPEWAGARQAGGPPDPSGAGDASAYGMIASVSVTASQTVGLVRCGLTEGALAALSATHNPLLAREPLATDGAGLERLKRLVPDVALRLVCGETEVEVRELAGLEVGDVLVVERSFVGLRAGRFYGEARLRAGDGPGTVIVGTLAGPRHETAGGARPESEGAGVEGRLGLLVKAVRGGKPRVAAERLKMEDDKNLGVTEEGAAALDALLLTVHVELAASRLGLEDIARLRAGQVLELDCKATDPVDLVVDGRRIARGELVDIEGRLGVRVMQLVS